MIAMLPAISLETGIFIARWDFSEPQSGKSICDQAASWVKRKVRMAMDAGWSAENAEEFVNAATSVEHGEIIGLSMIRGLMGTIENRKVVPAKISDISKLFNFELIPEGPDSLATHSIKAWKAYGIGPGQVLPEELWNGRELVTEFLKHAAFHQNDPEGQELLETDKYWKNIGHDSDQHVDTEDIAATCNNQEANLEHTAVEGNALFSCPEESCTMQYQSYGNLL